MVHNTFKFRKHAFSYQQQGIVETSRKIWHYFKCLEDFWKNFRTVLQCSLSELLARYIVGLLKILENHLELGKHGMILFNNIRKVSLKILLNL